MYIIFSLAVSILLFWKKKEILRPLFLSVFPSVYVKLSARGREKMNKSVVPAGPSAVAAASLRYFLFFSLVCRIY